MTNFLLLTIAVLLYLILVGESYDPMQQKPPQLSVVFTPQVFELKNS